MAQNSNSHDAKWLPNSQREMFSVYAGNAQSSCLVVGAVAICSTKKYLCFMHAYTNILVKRYILHIPYFVVQYIPQVAALEQ